MDLFLCPVCKGLLRQKERSYQCESGHSFDLAKQGYVNLLMSQQSKLRRHGDDKEMIASRRVFLEKGYYLPLRDALAEEVYFYTDKKASVLVDAGCGEGWYDEGIAKVLPHAAMIGLDISKDALRWAAKRQGFAHLAVASCFSMPLSENSADGIFNIFSPLAGEEYKRVLKPGGHLFRVVPGEGHLWELKAAVYDCPLPNRPEPKEIEGLRLLKERPVCYEMTLESREDIEALFQMTPYYYRTSQADREKLLFLDRLTARVEFNILIYEK